jgi:DUF971 family protein
MIHPAGVIADRSQRTLTITWEDGHESRYSFAGLRAVCPCAECKGGHENMGGPPDPIAVRDAPRNDLNLVQIVPVGSYALQFIWDDGHGAGLYGWEYLRLACPCAECVRGG